MSKVNRAKTQPTVCRCIPTGPDFLNVILPCVHFKAICVTTVRLGNCVQFVFVFTGIETTENTSPVKLASSFIQAQTFQQHVGLSELHLESGDYWPQFCQRVMSWLTQC